MERDSETSVQSPAVSSVGCVSSGRALFAQILGFFIDRRGKIKSAFPISRVIERESNETICGEYFEKSKAPRIC